MENEADTRKCFCISLQLGVGQRKPQGSRKKEEKGITIERGFLFIWWQMVAILTMVSIVWCVELSNHYAVHLKLYFIKILNEKKILNHSHTHTKEFLYLLLLPSHPFKFSCLEQKVRRDDQVIFQSHQPRTALEDQADHTLLSTANWESQGKILVLAGFNFWPCAFYHTILEKPPALIPPELLPCSSSKISGKACLF